ncbi:MAG: response regulator transcription factor [Bacteroidota bacterium]|nr:response regulator transcription factor [Bacteroidota bacterium]
MIRVFIVDDHPVVIEGIRSLLQHEKDIEWAGQAMNAQSCLGFFVNNTADIILMDINLPDTNGVDLCAVIKEKYPGIFVLGLSTFNQGLYIKKMMENGASGYILKNSSKDELLKAIHAVCDGSIYFSGEVGEALQQYQKTSGTELPALSRREKEVLELIAEGYTNPQIAEKLFVSPFTVDSHRKNLIAKLNVKNTAMLIRFAVEYKLI